MVFSVYHDFIFSASEDDSGTISENCIGEYSGVTRYNSKNLDRFVIDKFFFVHLKNLDSYLELFIWSDAARSSGPERGLRKIGPSQGKIVSLTM